MVRDFGLKLKIKILALGFATEKELYRQFLVVAPTSRLEQESFYKWVQGRSTPRSSKVYEHWAEMLQLDRPLTYLKSCSIEEFADDIIGSHEVKDGSINDSCGSIAGHGTKGRGVVNERRLRHPALTLCLRRVIS